MEEKKREGIQQVREYLQLEDIQNMKKLKAFLLLTDGSVVETVAIPS